MSQLRRCVKCGLPETYETIEFDAAGICNICRSAEHKKDKIDWAERRALLGKLIDKYRGRSEYDCIIPFSGGKDSTYTLYYLCKEFNVKPLVVRFNHGFMRPVIARNNEKTFKQLGVDVLEFTPNWKIVKRVMLEAFRRKTDFCWHCHTGIYSYPLQVAVRYKVPLLFWGEPLAEISAYYDYLNDSVEYEDEAKFNKCRNLGISADDMFGMINTPESPVDRRDLNPFTYPPLKELKALNYCSVCLGSFIPWDYVKQSQIIKDELGWESDELEGVPTCLNTSCEKIECFMQGPRDYIKFLKRGYSRITQISAFHLRNGRLSPEEAREFQSLEGRKPQALKVFLEYVGLTEDEFNEIVKPTTVPPYQHDYSKDVWAGKTWDFDQWYRENNR